ncbi:MAG TPA: hypothetical protein VIM99_13505, partial [Blastocatellia bacterium]
MRRKREGAEGRKTDAIQRLRHADPPSEFDEKKLLVKYVAQNLEAVYGVPVNDRPYDPLSELILTILSQSTTDVNSRRAFENLKKRFP